jgi:hypothetical protein
VSAAPASAAENPVPPLTSGEEVVVPSSAMEHNVEVA